MKKLAIQLDDGTVRGSILPHCAGAYIRVFDAVAADPGVSTETLAKKLKMDRSAVWDRLDALRAMGAIAKKTTPNRGRHWKPYGYFVAVKALRFVEIQDGKPKHETIKALPDLSDASWIAYYRLPRGERRRLEGRTVWR